MIGITPSSTSNGPISNGMNAITKANTANIADSIDMTK
jgi:hypothetical protein